MGRLVEAVLREDRAWNRTVSGLDPRYGAQDGYIPRFGTIDPNTNQLAEEWVSAQPYIKQNVIPVLLRAPKFFKYMPNPDIWIAGYKAIMEEHCKAITGISSGITVEVDETEIGGSNEVFEMPTGAKREQTRINTTIVDTAGRSIQRLLEDIIRYGMVDPDVKKPLVSLYMDVRRELQGVYTNDMFGSAMLYIEPDVTQQVVTNAWLCVNVWPKSGGEVTGRRDLRQAGEKNEMSIDWASITMNNYAVIAFAQKTLNQMSYLSVNPEYGMVVPMDSIDPDVSASNFGFNRKQR